MLMRLDLNEISITYSHIDFSKVEEEHAMRLDLHLIVPIEVGSRLAGMLTRIQAQSKRIAILKSEPSLEIARQGNKEAKKKPDDLRRARGGLHPRRCSYGVLIASKMRTHSS
jgi:hypothetical protein